MNIIFFCGCVFQKNYFFFGGVRQPKGEIPAKKKTPAQPTICEGWVI